MRTYQKSAELFEISKETLAGGVASSLRTAMKPIPLFLEKGEGSKVWDVDGNKYIDYIMGYGPLILGHSNKELLERLAESITSGQQFGMQHNGEIELSRRITELVPCAEKVAFSGSGTEAVMLALRLSRAKTGRQKVVRFEGHYHGWSDSIFTSFAATGTADQSESSSAGTAGQSLKALEDVIVLPWNDFEALEKTIQEQGGEIAAVITEPIMCNSGCILPADGYLEKMRELTAEHGIVMICDEVITGYRLSPGGAQQVLGIVPDLTTMGKAVAGGVALSVVAGKSEIMDLIADGTVNHLGTLNGNFVSMSAGLITLDILNRDDGAAYHHMNDIANELVDGIRDVFAKHDIPHLVNQVGPVFHVMFTDLDEVTTFDQFNSRDAAKYGIFAEKMLDHGIAVRPNGLWYVSTAHSKDDVAETLKAIDQIASEL